MALSTNVISGTLPPGVDPGIGNHIAFGVSGVFPPNDFDSGSACNNPVQQGCVAASGGTFDAVATPEPTTLLLFGTTMAGLGLARRKRRSQQ